MSHEAEPKPRLESNPKLVQRLPLYAALNATDLSRSPGKLAKNGA